MNTRLNYGRCRCGKPIVYKGAGFCSPKCHQEFASNILGFDTETELIQPGRQIPPLVCASFAMGEDAELVHWRDAEPVVRSMLEGDCTIVGHHLAFDFAVLCENFPDLTPLIFEVYWADRVSDTLIREKLGHIARGFYRRYETLDGDKSIPVEYSLEAVAQRRLQVQLDKGAESWRLRYGELRDLPLVEWPEPARKYALDDARILLPVWEQQEQAHKVLADQFRQARAAFWLQLMSAWGLHTDADGVRAFEKKTQQKYDAIAVELKAAGLMKPNGVRDTKAVKARVIAAYEKRPDVKLPKTAKDNVKTDEDTCKRSGDEVLIKYSELSSLKKTLSTDVPLLMQGIHVPIHTKFESLVATGRTASSPNVQNLPTAVGVRECFVPRPGMVFASADYSGFELRTWAQVCLELFGHSRLAEALNTGNDPHLEMARRMLDISYEEADRLNQLGDDKVYKARQSGKVCFHPDTEVLTRSGWMKISNLDPDVEVCSAILSDDGGVDLEWERPLALTEREFSGELVHLKNEGIDLRVTPDHRMCGWRRAIYRNGTHKDRVVTCLPEELGDVRYWPNAGLAPGHLQVDERLLRLAVAVQADGSYISSGSIRLGFTKKRKIERLRGLLKEGEYRFSFVGKGGVSTFWLERDLSTSVKGLLTEGKTLPWWWTDLVPELRDVVLEEARFWDSHSWPGGTGYGYSTIRRENVDVLQALATLTSRKSRCVQTPRPPYADAHYLSVKNKHRSRGGNLSVERVPYRGMVFCLTTRNDTVVVRDGGIPVITRQCNFGFPGGLGFKRFVEFARMNYGVIVSEKQARELKQFWSEAWPESKEYFDYIGRICESEVARASVEQLYVGRVRSDVGFTDACNSLFQGLAADAAKNAGFLIARACYAEPESVLYGCRPVNFVHDEFILEVPDDEFASDAAEELARLMVVGARPFLPDVEPKAEPQLMRRWSKKAKAIRDKETGKLVPWDWKVSP